MVRIVEFQLCLKCLIELQLHICLQEHLINVFAGRVSSVFDTHYKRCCAMRNSNFLLAQKSPFGELGEHLDLVSFKSLLLELKFIT